MKPNDLGPLPAVHARSVPCAEAKAELGLWLLEWRRRHALTSAEYLMLLAQETHGTLAMHVRHERRDGE